MTEPSIDGFDKAARHSQPAIRRLVLQAVDGLRDGVTDLEVRESIAQRSPVPIFESSAWLVFSRNLGEIFSTGSDGALFSTMKKAAAVALDSSPVADAAVFSFDPVFERAIDWLDREGAQLVTVVSDGTKAAIRSTMKDAFAEPLGTRQAARRILKIKGFGLNRPQTRSLKRYASNLVSGLDGAANLSSNQIDQLIRVRFRKLKRQRARLIARTESYNAASASQRELWSEAVAQRQLDEDRYVLEWITRVIRVCPRCIALSGTTAEIKGGTFTSNTVVGGGRYNGTQIVVERPTVHPDCYCAMRVVRRPGLAVVAGTSAVKVRICLVEQTRGSWVSF